MKKYNKSVNAGIRRINNIERLEAQLKTNTKNSAEGTFPLSKEDVSRIKLELEILKERV